MLTKPVFASIRLAHISMAFAGLMWLLPFLYSRHVFPLPGFYQEWVAALLGLLAMPLLVTRSFWQQPEIPRIVLLPIGLSLLVLVQFATGKVAYLDQALLFTLYMLWVVLLVMLGHRLREELGLPALCTALAACLLLGAELNAIIGLYQHYFWCTHPDYLFLDDLKLSNFSGNLAGSLGQPNHFANYITLGLVSLGLLHFRWQLRIWQMVLLAAPLLFVLTLSGSRSPWLYLLCMAGMAFLWQRRERKGGCLGQDRPQGERLAAVQIPSSLRLGTDLPALCAPLRGDAAGNPPAYPLRVLRVLLGLQPLTTTAYPLRVDKSSLPLLYYSMALLLGFCLMHFAVQIPWLAGCSGGFISGERLIAAAVEGGSGSIRLYLWREAWLIFTQYPLMGAGFGQFAWQHFQLGPVLCNTNVTELYDNAHNLVLQIAAEMGLAGLFILLGTLVLWFLQARTAQRTIYHWWGYGLLAVLAIHSLLEYPLWYAHFLGVAALTLGIFDTTTYRLKLREKHPLPEEKGTIASSPLGGVRRELVGRLSVAAMLLLGSLSLSQMIYLYSYGDFEASAGTLHASATDNSYAQRIRTKRVYDHMLTVQGHALLLRPYVERLLGATGWWDHVADKGALNERVMRYMPGSPVVYRQALLLAQFGQQAEARAQIERAIWAYPNDFPAHRDKLRALAYRSADPSRYSTLLEFSLQKYEEQQRAANTGCAQ